MAGKCEVMINTYPTDFETNTAYWGMCGKDADKQCKMIPPIIHLDGTEHPECVDKWFYICDEHIPQIDLTYAGMIKSSF